MSSLSSLLIRCQAYLQDENAQAWPLTQIETQLLAEIARLARQQLFGEVDWLQGQTGVSQYDFGSRVVDVAELLYDGRSLRPVKEASLTSYRRDWERTQKPPQFYTQELQAPN